MSLRCFDQNTTTDSVLFNHVFTALFMAAGLWGRNEPLSSTLLLCSMKCGFFEIGRVSLCFHANLHLDTNYI